MNRQEAEKIIHAERLRTYAHFGPPTGGTANRVCLYVLEGVWTSVATDERGVVLEATAREFSTESYALPEFIDALRVTKRLLEFTVRQALADPY